MPPDDLIAAATTAAAATPPPLRLSTSSPVTSSVVTSSLGSKAEDEDEATRRFTPPPPPTLAHFGGQGFPYLSHLRDTLRCAGAGGHRHADTKSVMARTAVRSASSPGVAIARELMHALGSERDCLDTNSLEQHLPVGFDDLMGSDPTLLDLVLPPVATVAANHESPSASAGFGLPQRRTSTWSSMRVGAGSNSGSDSSVSPAPSPRSLSCAGVGATGSDDGVLDSLTKVATPRTPTTPTTPRSPPWRSPIVKSLHDVSSDDEAYDSGDDVHGNVNGVTYHSVAAEKGSYAATALAAIAAAAAATAAATADGALQRAAYLASASVSSPMILLSQMVHLSEHLSRNDANGASPFAAAVGHSQGAAAAIAAASGGDPAAPLGVTIAARRYARCLLWSGVRAQAATAHAIALQQPTFDDSLPDMDPVSNDTAEAADASAPAASKHTSWRDPAAAAAMVLPPVCMVAVMDVTLDEVRDLLARVNATLPPAARLTVLLHNTRCSFVVGGTPLGIFALRRQVVATAAGMDPSLFPSVQGIAATVPFHSPAYLAEAAEATLEVGTVGHIRMKAFYPRSHIPTIMWLVYGLGCDDPVSLRRPPNVHCP